MVVMPDSAFEVNEPTVISETIDRETVIIHLNSGSYYSLKHSGAMIWAGIEESARINDIAAMVRASFEANGCDVEREVLALVGRLIEEDLIRPALAVPSSNGLLGALGFDAPAPFQAPILEKFTDLETMLLLDPVHDVDEKGWPNLQTQDHQLDD
jgi:coenzyme PQQ synthesis protein D (PqqD)